MRDDLKKLPLPKVAKAYARRHGLASMKRQPQDFLNVQATITNQKSKQYGFKNDDQGQPVKHEFNEEVDRIIRHVIEAEEEGEYKDLFSTQQRTFTVRKVRDDDEAVEYQIQVPAPENWSVPMFNVITLRHDEYAGEEIEIAVMERMKALAHSRNYPPGSAFHTPWGRYAIIGQRLEL